MSYTQDMLKIRALDAIVEELRKANARQEQMWAVALRLVDRIEKQIDKEEREEKEDAPSNRNEG
jgi:hypothetical protein